MYQKILVPIDGSDAAFAALDVACALADADQGSLVVVNVIPEGGLPEGLEEWATVEFKAQSPMWRYEDSLAQSILETARSRARAKGCTQVEERISRGDAAAKIVENATDCGADAIVIGTRGHSAIKSLVVGSVAQKVLHTAKCPVVAVH